MNGKLVHSTGLNCNMTLLIPNRPHNRIYRFTNWLKLGNSVAKGTWENHWLLLALDIYPITTVIIMVPNCVYRWIRLLFLSVTISLTMFISLRFCQNKNFLELIFDNTTIKEANKYPCVSLCALDLIDDFFEGPLKIDVVNFTSFNYLIFWWDGIICNEELLDINFTEVRLRHRNDFVDTCISSTFIYKHCKKINKDAPWDYLEPLCYTLHIQEHRTNLASTWNVESSIMKYTILKSSQILFFKFHEFLQSKGIW